MSFITEDFLLQSETARKLYSGHAARQPILDFHTHLSARDIAENHRFGNLFEMWLQGDHYKWRAMRANGVPEDYCTGNAPPYEKFLAWAKTVPYALRNPLYHWTHLELLRYFGIDELLDGETAASIWQRANRKLAEGSLTTQGILEKFGVKLLCTTDDPTDTLEFHRSIARQKLPTRVYPTFRPDRALDTSNVAEFNNWLNRLESCSGTEITRLFDLLDSLRKRHDFFHEHGCRASDHGLEVCFSDCCSETEAARIFAQVRGGHSVSPDESRKFASFLLLYTGHLDAQKGWVKQLHLGALRNVNAAMFRSVGRDSGFDSVGDWSHAASLGAFLGRLSEDNALPKTVLFNLNPADNYIFATMAGNFQDGALPGKIQMGSAWWFLDQKEGLEWQINALSNAGLLSRFIGMTTDSRSFMSYPRHEYFRRVLCNLLGSEVERGELPQDDALLDSLIEGVCYRNAKEYFAFPERIDAKSSAIKEEITPRAN